VNTSGATANSAANSTPGITAGTGQTRSRLDRSRHLPPDARAEEAIPTPPIPRASFAERSSWPVAPQEEANEIDMAAGTPAVSAGSVQSVPATAPASGGMQPPRAQPVSRDDATTMESVASTGQNIEKKSPPADDQEMSWLRKIFVGLGGLLAVASAFRMFIG
jgi:hypothetical protein